MKPHAGASRSYLDELREQEALMVETDGERELLEGLEGTTVQEKHVDADFFNSFEDDFDEDDMALPK
jgi:hypothetical protein